MIDIPAAVRAVVPLYQRQFARKPLLPLEMASTVVFYDGMSLLGFGAELEVLRQMKNPEDVVLQIIRDERLV